MIPKTWQQARRLASAIRNLHDYGSPGGDFDVRADHGVIRGRHESCGSWRLTVAEARRYLRDVKHEVLG